MAIQFVQAANYTTANRGRGDIKFIVIHDMEMAEKPTTAEDCAAYFARATTQASSHYTVDNDSVVQCVRDKDVAWCAPGANSTGLHFEHAGFASQARTDWLDPFSKAMLTVSAGIVAAKCAQYGIPIRKGDASDILAGRPCIVGHWDVTKAYPDKGSHTDPGANFPWDYYIGLVQAASTPTPVNPLEDDMFDETDRGRLNYAANVAGPRTATILSEVTAARTELAALTAAVQTLAASKGADSAAIIAEVGTAVRDRLAQIVVTVSEPGA